MATFDRLTLRRETADFSLTDQHGDAWLWVSFDSANRLGYFINIRELGETEEMVLVEDTTRTQIVSGLIGGQRDERPQFVFVKADTAMQATKYFFNTGQRDPSLEWLPFPETT
ncbi:MAG: hypothetical protein KDA86_17760 [Planctomycetaceae bacterium]|nr:hypothetical protein [Planctomycetaceae bacterium]